jgi:hypothetical protein
MCFQPKSASGSGWIDAALNPPSGFIATPMHFAMVSPTKRDREFVADLAAECR